MNFFTKQITNSRRIFGLDLMRAIAILMVLGSHSLWIFPKNNNNIFKLLELGGFLGVEIFFVLSGFLIGKILFRLFTNSDFSFSDIKVFLKRRWFRTLPNYFLILFINIIIAGIIGYETKELWKYFFFIHNFSDAMPAFFPESWSLSVEEWAYLLLPFTLFAGMAIFSKINKSLLFFWIALLLIAFFIGTKISYYFNSSTFNPDYWNLHLKGVVVYRLDSIFFGVLSSWIFFNCNQAWKKYKMYTFAIGLLGLAFLHFGIGKFSFFYENINLFYTVFYIPLNSICIAFFLPFLSEWKTERAIIKKPIVFISLISYSIYLLHYSIILNLIKYYFPTDSLAALPLLGYLFSYFALTICSSTLLYRFFEKPVMDLRDR